MHSNNIIYNVKNCQSIDDINKFCSTLNCVHSFIYNESFNNVYSCDDGYVNIKCSIKDNNAIIILNKTNSVINNIYNEDKGTSTKIILKDAGVKSGKLPLSGDKEINDIKKYLDSNDALISLAKVPEHSKFTINGQKPKVAKCLRTGTDTNYIYINVSDIPKFAKMCSKIERNINDDTNIVRALSHVADPNSINNVAKIKNTFLVQYLNEQPIIPIQYTNQLCEIISKINDELQINNIKYRVGFGVYAGNLSVSSRYRLKASQMKFENVESATSLRMIIYTSKKTKNTDNAASSVSVLIDKNFAGKGYELSSITTPAQIKQLFNSVKDPATKNILLKYYKDILSICESEIMPDKDANSRAVLNVIYAIQIKGNLPHFICYIEQNEGGYKLASADRDSDYKITANGLIKA